MKTPPMGDGALRLTLPESVNRPALLEALRRQPRVLDAVVTDRHALVQFDPSHPPDDPAPLLELFRTPAGLSPARHVVRVRYDGPDIDEVASLLGISREEVASRHSGREYEAQLVGFLPGFAYLGPLDDVLAGVPRRASPRPRVPALSVGIASGRTAIYPFASPGGWQLIGTAVDFTPFDPEKGAAFRLGDLVRFEPAT